MPSLTFSAFVTLNSGVTPNAEIVERWNNRVIGLGMQHDSNPADAYMARFGKGMKAPKAVMFARQAEISGFPDMAIGFWRFAYQLAGVATSGTLALPSTAPAKTPPAKAGKPRSAIDAKIRKVVLDYIENEVRYCLTDCSDSMHESEKAQERFGALTDDADIDAFILKHMLKEYAAETLRIAEEYDSLNRLARPSVCALPVHLNDFKHLLTPAQLAKIGA